MVQPPSSYYNRRFHIEPRVFPVAYYDSAFNSRLICSPDSSYDLRLTCVLRVHTLYARDLRRSALDFDIRLKSADSWVHHKQGATRQAAVVTGTPALISAGV